MIEVLLTPEQAAHVHTVGGKRKTTALRVMWDEYSQSPRELILHVPFGTLKQNNIIRFHSENHAWVAQMCEVTGLKGKSDAVRQVIHWHALYGKKRDIVGYKVKHFPNGGPRKAKVGTISDTQHSKQLFIMTENGWQALHRYVWEQHNGPIPDKHSIMFKDRNVRNCSLDNLMLMSREESVLYSLSAPHTPGMGEVIKLRQKLGVLLSKKGIK